MKKIGKILEIFFPYVALIITFWILRKIFKEDNITINLIDTLLESIFSIITTLIGFFITALTIFITFIKSKIMQYLRNNKILNRILYFFYEPIIIGVILIGIVIFLMISVEDNNIINTNYFIMQLSMLILFLCSISRAILIIFIIFKCALEDPKIIEND